LEHMHAAESDARPRTGRPSAGDGARGERVVEPESTENRRVLRIPLGEIDRADTRFRFRAVVRVPDLLRSLSAFGQQVPAIVRPHPDERRGFRYQLISGFRRVEALTELGHETVDAVVREDLVDDDDAFRTSVLENVARKTYSDIDRASIIRRVQEQGRRTDEVANLMDLSRRQVHNLLSLLDLPAEVQAAIADESQPFTTTHALTLRQLSQKHRGLVYIDWIERVNAEGLSIPEMTRAVKASIRARASRRAMASIFQGEGKDRERGVFRLRPVKFDVSTLSDAERGRLRDELETVLRAL
jgi:ParB/RepB/Spo0J family partition protein